MVQQLYIALAVVTRCHPPAMCAVLLCTVKLLDAFHAMVLTGAEICHSKVFIYVFAYLPYWPVVTCSGTLGNTFPL